MEYLLLALNFAVKLMDKLPNYDQRKKDDFFDKSNRLREEWNKPLHLRDDDLILNLRDESVLMLNTFYKEIENE